MKNIFCLILLTISCSLMAQAPQSFFYQGQASIDGEIIANESINVQAALVANGIEVFTDTHESASNSSGDFYITIGQGQNSIGIFDSIDWSVETMEVRLLIENQSGQLEYLSQEQLHYQPYAFYAASGVGIPGKTGETGDTGPGGGAAPEGQDGDDGADGHVHWNTNGDDIYYDQYVGIGTDVATELLDVGGDICYSGNMTSCSDRRYKINIRPISNALEGFTNIDVVSYLWRQAEFPAKKFNDELQLGVIAQQVRSFFPEMVLQDAKGFLAVDYGKLNVVSIEAIKDQQARIENLKEERYLLLSEMEE